MPGNHPALLKADNEKLRGLLAEVAHCLRTSDEQPLYWEEEFASRIYRALSQQAEPVCDWPTCECALDLDKCKVQSVEPAPAQDERETVSHDAELYGIGFMVDGVRVSPDRVTIQYGRSAQTEQQPIRLPQRKNLDGLLDPESKRAGRAYNEALEDVELLNAAPIAQTALPTQGAVEQ